MSATCPAGHSSVAEDYCDVCGMPIEPAAGAATPAGNAGASVLAAPGVPAATQACPHCGTPNPTDALFCEACGYDFTTGSMPRPLTPPDGVPAAPVPAAPAPAPPAAPAPGAPVAGSGWVVERWVDPAWYQEQESPDPLLSAVLPWGQSLHGTVL